jgi:drug/metabolite transporter (DMT)-like permease
MTTTITAPQHAARQRPASHRPWWPWLATFAAFPPAGYAGWLLAGHVDSAAAAAVAGVVTGAVLGLGQWLLLRRRGVAFRWVPATAVALGVGLMAGAAIVGYDVDRVSLAVMGAITGVIVGVAQGAVTRARLSSVLAWGGATAGLWAIGWVVSSYVIDPADQWPIFGASGAIVVCLLQSTFIERVLALDPKGATTRAAS